MANQTPEELENEADELFYEANGIPKPEEGEDTVSEPEPNTDEVEDEGEDEVTPPQPESEPNPDEEEEPSPPDQDTDLDGLSVEKLQERYRNAQARMTQATQEASTLRKETERLQGENTRLQGELDQAKSELETAQTTRPADTGETDIQDDDLQSAMDEYPEVVGPMLKTIKRLEQKLEALDGTVTKTVEEQKKTSDQSDWEKAVAEKHSDFDEILSSDEWSGWLSRQTPGIQAMANNATPADAIYLLNQYKEAIGHSTEPDKGPSPEPRLGPDVVPETRSRTRTPSKGRTIFTREQINSMSPKEFAENEAEIDKQMAEGLIQ